jgi:excisionase family DNA binding protein
MPIAERLAYRPNGAGAALGISRDVIFKALAAGEIRSFKAGRVRLIPAGSLREYMARQIEEQG